MGHAISQQMLRKMASYAPARHGHLNGTANDIKLHQALPVSLDACRTTRSGDRRYFRTPPSAYATNLVAGHICLTRLRDQVIFCQLNSTLQAALLIATSFTDSAIMRVNSYAWTSSRDQTLFVNLWLAPCAIALRLSAWNSTFTQLLPQSSGFW